MHPQSPVQRSAAAGTAGGRQDVDEIHESFDFLEIEDVCQVPAHAAALAERDFDLPTAQPT